MNLWNWKVTTLLGASFGGIWTLFVNWNGGVESAIISSIVQASISAVLIAFLSLGMNFF